MPRISKAAGSVALVTGANRGIGLAFVQELAARGARKVYAGVRSPGDVTGQFKELPVEVVPLDVTDLALVRAAAAGCPDVNLLVNNAGLFTNHRRSSSGPSTPGWPRTFRAARKTRGTSPGRAWTRSTAASTWPIPTSWPSRPEPGTPGTRSGTSTG
jgi:NAD(P)-dependent dehydrogenase (short-subunit alcohol dehydrogenase family)